MNKHVYTLGMVDDRPEELVMIQRYISRMQYLSVLFTETDPMQAITRMEEQCPDILLLDMQMPGLDGLQLYQSLAVKPVLVICSGHTDFAYQASQLEAAAYLPKWIAFEDFETAILRAIAQYDVKNPGDVNYESIQLTAAQGNGARIHIPVSAILHAEVDDKIVTFHCSDFERKARISLDAVESLLPADQFLRTHKSHLVRLARVTSFSQTNLFLHGYPNAIPIGRSYLASAWDRLEQKA